MTRPAPARIAVLNGGRSTARSSRSPTGMRTAPRSVLAGAAPKPGKCLAVAATPPARRPRVKAAPKRAAPRAPKPNPRPSACRALSGRTTSTTGARSTFMPAARSVAAVARPSARATDGRPVAAIAGALRDGAPGRRCTLPPSWSTMSSRGAPRPAGRGDAPQRPRERAHLRRRAEVGAEEDDARRLAAADAREQRRRRRAPGEGEDDVLAGQLRVGQARGRPRRRRAGRLRVGGPPSSWSPGRRTRPWRRRRRGARAASAAAQALTARSWSPRSGAARPRR